MNQPRVSPATQWYESRNQELQTELESLKAQLAKVSEQRDQYATFRRNEEVARKASEARVRELRELLTNAFEECAGIADSMYNRRGFDVGQEIRKRLNQNKELAALRSVPPSGPKLCEDCHEPSTHFLHHADAELLRCSTLAPDDYHPFRPPIKQAPFDKTDAWEERKDLARQVPAQGIAPASDKDGVAVGLENLPSDSPRSETSGPQDSPSRSQEAVLIPPTLWTELRKFLNRRMERDRWLKEQVLLMQGLEDCADPERRRAMNFCPMCHETGNDFDRRGNYRGECVCVKPAKEHGDSFVRDLTCAPPSPAREQEKAE